MVGEGFVGAAVGYVMRQSSHSLEITEKSHENSG